MVLLQSNITLLHNITTNITTNDEIYVFRSKLNETYSYKLSLCLKKGLKSVHFSSRGRFSRKTEFFVLKLYWNRTP